MHSVLVAKKLPDGTVIGYKFSCKKLEDMLEELLNESKKNSKRNGTEDYQSQEY